MAYRQVQPAPPTAGGDVGFLPEHLREVAGRVLVARVTSMRGEVAAWSTGDLAARLATRAETSERADLNDALAILHSRPDRLLRYDREQNGGLIWFLARRGVDVARALPTGVSGAPRRLG